MADPYSIEHNWVAKATDRAGTPEPRDLQAHRPRYFSPVRHSRSASAGSAGMSRGWCGALAGALRLVQSSSLRRALGREVCLRVTA